MTRNTEMMKPPLNIVERLLKERDKHAEIARLELRNDQPDYGIVNEHDAQALLFFEAAEMIRRLDERSVYMVKELQRRRATV